jgi:hypothetical protein
MNKLLTMTFAAALLMAGAGPAYADHNEKTVFVTSVSFNGNLGWLTGADEKCQAQAWLSDGFDSPDIRFTKSAHPYILPDGTKIAEDFTDLTDGSLLHSIDIDPTGEPVGLEQFWSGTNANGTTAAYTQTCDGWTAAANSRGMAGRTNVSSSLWSSIWANPRCSQTFRLVCFQQ